MRLVSIILLTIAVLLGVPLVALVLYSLFRSYRLNRRWRALEIPSSREVFSEAMVADLPPLVQRYFLHALKPGAPLPVSVQLKNAAQYTLKPGATASPFREQRIITPYHGGIWKTSAYTNRMQVYENAYYQDGEAEEGGQAYWLVPLRYKMNSAPDLAKLFRCRLIAESVFVPAALLPQHGVVWEQLDEQHARASLTVDGVTLPLTLQIDPDGRLREVRFDFWNCKGTPVWRDIPSGLIVHAEQTYGDYTIPSDYSLTLWYKTPEREPGISLRYAVEQAQFR
ncbi:MAG: hypothetical protein OHK0022_23200 [Roseiflexaceae bacterium]